MPPHDETLLRCTPWVCALACALGEHAGASAYEWGRPYDEMRVQVGADAPRYLRQLLPDAPIEMIEAAAIAYVDGWEKAALTVLD